MTTTTLIMNLVLSVLAITAVYGIAWFVGVRRDRDVAVAAEPWRRDGQRRDGQRLAA